MKLPLFTNLSFRAPLLCPAPAEKTPKPVLAFPKRPGICYVISPTLGKGHTGSEAGREKRSDFFKRPNRQRRTAGESKQILAALLAQAVI